MYAEPTTRDDHFCCDVIHVPLLIIKRAIQATTCINFNIKK